SRRAAPARARAARRACRCAMAAARSRLALREEAVADPPDGEEVARVGRILLETLAEPQDEVVDRAGRGKDVIAPHPLEQVLARDDLAGVLLPCSRNVRHMARPSMPGSITSSTMSAQCCPRSHSSARSASPAALTS